MKLVGDLKDKVEKAENQEAAKEIIKEAGMDLTDEEMDQVEGGYYGDKFLDKYGPNFIQWLVLIGIREKNERMDAMKLIGELKDKVEKAENQEEAKKIIEKAGMELTDEEMDQVAGGFL